jgi:hypothetical protein
VVRDHLLEGAEIVHAEGVEVLHRDALPVRDRLDEPDDLGRQIQAVDSWTRGVA